MRKLLCVLLCLVCLTPALAVGEENTLVIKKFSKLKEITQQIADSGCDIIDITAQPATPRNLHALKEMFPDKTFLYTVSAFNRRIPWDSEEVDLKYNEVKNLKALEEVLSLLPRIRTLTTYHGYYSAEELDSLRATYPTLTTINCRLHFSHYIVRTDITAFCTKHATYSERHTEEDFQALRYCRNLKALDLGHNSIKDISFLRELPKLQILILADNDISDLSPLESQPDLEYLELFRNEDLSDISVLAGCPKLFDLHLGHCNISDISPLYSLRKLDRLWLPQNPIPQEQLDHMQSLLPQCRINTTAIDHPTAEGWRQKHPRYLKIVEIFEKNKYIPFP